MALPITNSKATIASSRIPVPGTVPTASAALTPGYIQPTAQHPAPQIAQSTQVAQSNVDLGRATRGGRSYLGVAANIGIERGESSLGDGNFALVSKIGLTNTFSARPGVVFGDSTTILLPVTYDFSFSQPNDIFNEPLPVSPFVGVGAAIKTSNDTKIAPLVTVGIDVPLNQQFTATASVNAGFFDRTDVGVLLGVGYNFSGF